MPNRPSLLCLSAVSASRRRPAKFQGWSGHSESNFLVHSITSLAEGIDARASFVIEQTGLRGLLKLNGSVGAFIL